MPVGIRMSRNCRTIADVGRVAVLEGDAVLVELNDGASRHIRNLSDYIVDVGERKGVIPGWPLVVDDTFEHIECAANDDGIRVRLAECLDSKVISSTETEYAVRNLVSRCRKAVKQTDIRDLQGRIIPVISVGEVVGSAVNYDDIGVDEVPLIMLMDLTSLSAS